LKMYLLLKMVVFHGYVSLPEGKTLLLTGSGAHFVRIPGAPPTVFIARGSKDPPSDLRFSDSILRGGVFFPTFSGVFFPNLWTFRIGQMAIFFPIPT